MCELRTLGCVGLKSWLATKYLQPSVPVLKAGVCMCVCVGGGGGGICLCYRVGFLSSFSLYTCIFMYIVYVPAV